MRILMTAMVLSLGWSAAAVFAEVTVYHIFADGLKCDSCVSDIDRQLTEIEGVDSVDIFSEPGVINVRMAEGYELTDAQVQEILDDAGVTFDHIEHHAMGEH